MANMHGVIVPRAKLADIVGSSDITFLEAVGGMKNGRLEYVTLCLLYNN